MTGEWSGSTRIRVRTVRVERMPECEVHPDIDQADGVLSITWSNGHVYACRDCADGPFGRFAAALDDSPETSLVDVELQVLAAAVPAQIARAA